MRRLPRGRPPTCSPACSSATSSIPAIPASGAGTVDGVTIDDPAVRVAFFALRHDQDCQHADPRCSPATRPATPRAPISTTACSRSRSRRAASSSPTRSSTRVVPAILAGTTDVKPEGDTLVEVRRDQQRAAAKERGEDRVVREPDRARDVVGRRRLSSVHEHRRRVRVCGPAHVHLQGKEVDHQMHLGFDLASFTGTPIVAANRGKVLFADELGHLRQLRDPRPRDGRAVALRAPLVAAIR